MTFPSFRVEARHGVRLAGIAAALVLAAVVNVLSARHFTRWDWTDDSLWSLSPATLETLRSLDRDLDVWVIAGPGDPLEQGLRQLLIAYRGASPRVRVHTIDPDRDAVKVIDLQRRFGLEAGRSDDGRVAADAMVIVAQGEKHWFLTPSDLVEPSDDTRAKPREERALTQAMRSVLGGQKAKLCFTEGHGELSLDPGRDPREGLLALRDLFERNNYALAPVDTTAPDAHAPFVGCDVAVIAGAKTPFAPDESTRLRAWLLQGGNLFAAIGPIEADTQTGMAPSGLDDVLAPFGVSLADDLVHDVALAATIPDTHGEGFFAVVKPHAITASLVRDVANPHNAHPPRVALFFTRSLHHVASPQSAVAVDLLSTTPDAFAKTRIVGAAGWADVPPRDALDPSGPFTLAMAAERPPTSPSAPHGPRVVVVGSRFVLAEDNWRQPHALHGAAFFVDSALAWLAARPTVVDVPEHADVPVAVRVSPEGREEVKRYVLILMPLAAALLGVSVWAWRRSSEDRPYETRDASHDA